MLTVTEKYLHCTQLCRVKVLCCAWCFKGGHELTEGTSSKIQATGKKAYLKPTVVGAVFLSFYVCFIGKRHDNVGGCELFFGISHLHAVSADQFSKWDASVGNKENLKA